METILTFNRPLRCVEQQLKVFYHRMKNKYRNRPKALKKTLKLQIKIVVKRGQEETVFDPSISRKFV